MLPWGGRDDKLADDEQSVSTAGARTLTAAQRNGHSVQSARPRPPSRVRPRLCSPAARLRRKKSYPYGHNGASLRAASKQKSCRLVHRRCGYTQAGNALCETTHTGEPRNKASSSGRRAATADILSEQMHILGLK